MTKQRDSKAEEAPLVNDPNEIAVIEAENAVNQFDAVLDLIDEVERDGRKFRLRVSVVQQLHRLAMDRLSRYAGNWRPGKVEIVHSKHVPPDVHLVMGLMEEMCDWVNEHWETNSALELSAYVMWRLNWIHPFDDGNGRTSRAVSYLVLCCKAGSRLPGGVTIPELIARNKGPYYEALEKIDESDIVGQLNLDPLLELLETCLAEQLSQAYQAATATDNSRDSVRKFH